jgi:phosphate transport system permease protein
MIQPSSRVPEPDPAGGHASEAERLEPFRVSGSEIPRRWPSGFGFAVMCSAATWLSCTILAVLLITVVVQAWGWFDLQFLTSFDSRKPERAGLFAGLWGTFWVILLTMLFSVPVGIGAAIYLEEYAGDTWITRLIRINLANLAGVPSIVYGLLGLTVFVRMFGVFADGGAAEKWTGRAIDGVTLWTTPAGEAVRVPLPFGTTVIAGALTLSLLILPVIIVASQEALRAVSPTLRHASLALGATKWQTIRHQVLPAGLPGMLTGIILAVSRAIGETAPLLMIGAATFVTFTPGSVTHVRQLARDPAAVVQAPFDTFTAVPIQIFNWATQPQSEYEHVAAAGILVLLLMLLVLNGTAIYIRYQFQKARRW